MTIHIIDTFGKIDEYRRKNSAFSLDTYASYADAISPSLYQKCFDDAAEYDFATDVLPVINAALYQNFDRIASAHEALAKVASFLPDRIEKIFDVGPDITIIFYLGLCNGAGWATTLDGRNVILLGAEKISELGWQSLDSMADLICHEAAHLVHFALREGLPQPRTPIWQLYAEGFATRVSQLLYRDGFYHLDQNGWLDFCISHMAEISAEYLSRLEKQSNTAIFFGDWNKFMGQSNLGYFLGCEFILWLEKSYTVREAACLDANTIENKLLMFLKHKGQN